MDRSRVDSRGILNDEDTGEGEEAVGGVRGVRGVGGVGGVGGVRCMDGEEGRGGVTVEEAAEYDDVRCDERDGGRRKFEGGGGGEGAGESDADTVSAV